MWMFPNAATAHRISTEDTTHIETTATATNTDSAMPPTTIMDTKPSTAETIFIIATTANPTTTAAITTGTGIVLDREFKSAQILAYTGNEFV
jgi:hypothetical protein